MAAKKGAKKSSKLKGKSLGKTTTLKKIAVGGARRFKY